MSIEKRLERLEAILDARGLDWDHPRVEEDHFAGANKMVAEEPAKEASLDGLPDIRAFAQPNLRWRILELGEVVCSIDWANAKANPPSDPPNGFGWIPVSDSVGCSVCEDDPCIFARPVADEPSKELGPPSLATVAGQDGRETREISPGDWGYIRDAYRDATPADVGKLVYVRSDAKTPWVELRLAEVTGADFPYRCTKDGLDPTMWQAFRYAVIRNERPANKAEPAWEPKVGDWVRVTRPSDWEGCRDPDWLPIMHEYHDKVMQVSSYENRRGAWCAKCDGVGWFFHRDWLTPSIQYFAEPPEVDKPLEPEYREPVLPADYKMACEFSDNGSIWASGRLGGWRVGSNWISTVGVCWQHCRIKKDA